MSKLFYFFVGLAFGFWWDTFITTLRFWAETRGLH